MIENEIDWYFHIIHYIDVIITTMASQISSLTAVYSTVYSDADQKKTSKLRVTDLCVGNSPGPVNSSHKGPVTREMFPFDDVIMIVVIEARPLISGAKNWDGIQKWFV